jgi:UDP-N-acetylmuramate: L-alanyl-gamma-D-glutamyl-meso-diaminopimelate ligase
MESYLNAFRALLKILPDDYTLIANGDYPDIRKILKEFANLKPEFYSTASEDAHWTVKNVKYELEKSSFDLFYKGEIVESFETPLVGDFNISNAVSAIALAISMGLPKAAIKKAIETFDGVKRRQEKIGKINDAIIIEDFAHHPTAVEGVLKAFSRIENRGDVWAIFEPRSATARRKIFEKEFLEALALADRIILPDPIDRGDIPKEKLFSSKNVISELNSRSKKAYNITDVDEIVNKLSVEAKPSDIIIIMSNGGFGGIYKKLLSKGSK